MAQDLLRRIRCMNTVRQSLGRAFVQGAIGDAQLNDLHMADDSRADYEEKLRTVALATGYPRETVAWVIAALNHGSARARATTDSPHFDAAALCRMLVADVLAVGSGNLRDDLTRAGVLSSRDVGRIMFGLIEAGLGTAESGESEADFAAIFETAAIDAYCARVGLRRRLSIAVMKQRFSWICYLAGFAVVVLSYTGAVSHRIGWIGWIVGMLGFVVFYIPAPKPPRFGD